MRNYPSAALMVATKYLLACEPPHRSGRPRVALSNPCPAWRRAGNRRRPSEGDEPPCHWKPVSPTRSRMRPYACQTAKSGQRWRQPLSSCNHSFFRNASVGRKRRWAEDMTARFPAGTLARIDDVLRDKEFRTNFVWLAVEKELKRREAKGAKPAKPAKPRT
jgi:hypothetical protein